MRPRGVLIRAVLCVLLPGFVGGCASDPRVVARPNDLKEIFPSVRVSTSARVVEFDGMVPLDVHNEQTPLVYLELIACAPDTREHESLVMTRARPSHIHAALLLIGLKPGSPGTWRVAGDGFEAVPPTGDAVRVTLAYESGQGEEIAQPAQRWVVDHRTGRTLGETGRRGWVFSGSLDVQHRGQPFYDADGSGTVIGLTTFGAKVIAWREVFSHDAAVQTPSWIANASFVPRFGTPIVVRIAPAR